MAKKTFLNRAEQSIAEGGQNLLTEELVPPSEMTRAEYEGTTRLKEARSIPIDKIKPDPNQPRTQYDAESLNELADSIREHGVIQPITVEYVATDDYFKIITGERRYRASLRAELTEMPCIVRSMDTKVRLAHQLIENIQREDLNPIDKARGLLELRATLGPNAQWKEVEKITGISERRRQQFLALLDLPKDIQTKIVALGKRPANNAITEKHARALLRLGKYEDKQRELLKKITSSKIPITGDDALKIAKDMVGGNGKTSNKQKIIFFYSTNNDLIKQLEAKLKELKTKKKIKTRT